jgi:hypothetical protein
MSDRLRLQSQNFPMTYFNALEDSIKHFAEMIAAELAERKIYDQKEFEVFIRTRMYIALHELLKIESSELEEKRKGLVDAYTSDIPASQKKQLRHQLSILTPRLKELHRLRKSFDDFNEYKQLKGFVKEKFGAEELDNFFQNHLKKGSKGVQFVKHPSKN